MENNGERLFRGISLASIISSLTCPLTFPITSLFLYLCFSFSPLLLPRAGNRRRRTRTRTQGYLFERNGAIRRNCLSRADSRISRRESPLASEFPSIVKSDLVRDISATRRIARGCRRRRRSLGDQKDFGASKWAKAPAANERLAAR